MFSLPPELVWSTASFGNKIIQKTCKIKCEASEFYWYTLSGKTHTPSASIHLPLLSMTTTSNGNAHGFRRNRTAW
ncbi:hypothetical protein M5D96_013368 [Drosophila gunungcola]|uniref:Uncharacterized protein n=1 Tax=Drosophila gunungcola TaxID=103775 RepID=A0A9Q0BIL0_9MUSC|nr:hypothetical protein M5D96_013368 [Drosophila gunungcola]